MIRYIGALIIFMSLSGCFPFSDDEDINNFIKQEDNKSISLAKSYKVKPIEKLADYVPYTFKSTIDPFKAKEFALKPKDSVVNQINCDSGSDGCGSPPEPHVKGLLEHYELTSFSLVGVIKDDKNTEVALVRSSDLGVVTVRKGDYIGKKNGLVVSIDNDTVVVREKLLESGKWKDMRKTLIIK